MPDFLIDTAQLNENTGIGKVYYAEYSEFTNIATLPASPASQADKVTISSDHTFGASDGFRTMYALDIKSSLMVKGIGEEGAGGSEVVLECFFPGTKKEFSAFIKDNPEMILLVEHPDCAAGEYYQVGTKCRPARIMRDYEFQSGTANDGQRGWTFRVHAYQSTLLYYTGSLTPAL